MDKQESSIEKLIRQSHNLTPQKILDRYKNSAKLSSFEKVPNYDPKGLGVLGNADSDKDDLEEGSKPFI